MCCPPNMFYFTRLTKPDLLVQLKSNSEGEKGCRLGKIQAEKISCISKKCVCYFKETVNFRAMDYSSHGGLLNHIQKASMRGIVLSSKIDRFFEITNIPIIFSGLLILQIFAPFPASSEQRLPFGPKVSYTKMTAWIRWSSGMFQKNLLTLQSWRNLPGSKKQTFQKNLTTKKILLRWCLEPVFLCPNFFSTHPCESW